MVQIAAQWLRGSDLEIVLAQDLNSVAQWFSLISTHENRIKIYLTNFFFFLKFEIRNSNFFFFSLTGQCHFSFSFFPLIYIYIYIYFETLLIKENKTTIISIFFFLSLVTTFGQCPHSHHFAFHYLNLWLSSILVNDPFSCHF